MISIITPFYQSEKYLAKAIQSVLNQSLENWELLLINDGSTDHSKQIAFSFPDKRIRYFEQENQGVSAARNLGLENMKGDYFCFLDADDILPTTSLESRFKLFKENPNLMFVDGQVKKFDHDMNEIIQTWNPDFKGNPLKDLVQLSGKSFLGLTWMIKWEPHKSYKFQLNISHSEDLLFFMNLAKDGGIYSYTDKTILYYRDTPDSAMKNLKGLENGYRYTEREIMKWNEIDSSLMKIYKYKYKRAMFLAYLKALQPLNAIKSIL